jgi:transcriptional regulator with GAF, ATPase, and Fis domain
VLTGSTRPGVPSSKLPPPRLALYVVYPPELAARVIELRPGLTIGREPTLLPAGEGAAAEPETFPFATLRHATVSRRHCSVEDGFGTPILVDLESSNGTKVDGVLLKSRSALAPQSVVRFGEVLAVVDEQPLPDGPWTPALPGVAPAVARAREAIERAAQTTAPVVVLGETGTGKERVAAELHRRSGRTGPYVKFSCAELARELVESQLFGHERGAFTGATSAQKGLFVAADRGTLFLDEIGELPLELQAKLLRVLQEGEVRPLGSLGTQRVDVRVVAATNRELADDVERGSFRRDLYARLTFFEVRLPPLRARRQDLLWWIERLVANFAEANQANVPPLRLQPDAAELVLLHAWPENLRGLDRLVHRVLTSGEAVVGRRVLAALMPEIVKESSNPSAGPGGVSDAAVEIEVGSARESAPPATDRPSREEFVSVYESTGRNVRATSKHFGKDRRQIYRWLELFGIER